MFEALLSPESFVGHCDDLQNIVKCLKRALDRNGKTEPRFAYHQRILHLNYSVWIVGIGSFENGDRFPTPITFREFAQKLLRHSGEAKQEDCARYPTAPACFATIPVKGWTISRSAEHVDSAGNPLVAAYATWVVP